MLKAAQPGCSTDMMMKSIGGVCGTCEKRRKVCGEEVDGKKPLE